MNLSPTALHVNYLQCFSVVKTYHAILFLYRALYKNASLLAKFNKRVILLCLSLHLLHIHSLADKAEDPSNGHRVYRHNIIPNKVMSVYRRRNCSRHADKQAYTPFSHTYTRFINTREVTAPRWQCSSSITKHNCRANGSSYVTNSHRKLMDYDVMFGLKANFVFPAKSMWMLLQSCRTTATHCEYFKDSTDPDERWENTHLVRPSIQCDILYLWI